MKQPSLGAALAAVFITVFLWIPEASGLHLVSNQPTGTDNQNNAPVQYVPKMASKLGLPQPQNHEPEYLTDEALATAVRQLIESNTRQSAFLERLAALALKPKTQEYFQKKTTNPPVGTSETSESNIMRPVHQTEHVFTPDPEAHNLNKTVERVTVNFKPLQTVHYSSETPHHSVVSPLRHFVSCGSPNSHFPVHFPVPPHSIPQGLYPHFVGEGTHNQNSRIIPQGRPSFTIQYPYTSYPVNTQPANVVSPVSQDYRTHFPENTHNFPVNPHHYSVNPHDFSGNPQNIPVNPHDFPVNHHKPDVNAQQYSYVYPKRPQGY